MFDLSRNKVIKTVNNKYPEPEDIYIVQDIFKVPKLNKLINYKKILLKTISYY